VFPSGESENLLICVSGVGARSGFSVNMTNRVPDLQAMDNGQCYPRFLYEAESESIDATGRNGDFFSNPEVQTSKRRHAVTDAGLEYFRSAYKGATIEKDDLFYYVYGILHSVDYRERYADNLTKELPRIPRVKTTADFWEFALAGRKLADLHINYESQPCHTVQYKGGPTFMKSLEDNDHRVQKMKFGKAKIDGKVVDDRTTVIYNEKITMTGIPLEAYEYVVNGRPALEWVMERQCTKIDKDSGIVNDANDWAVETRENPRYSLELFQRVITVSLETMKIVRALPILEIMA